MNIDRIRVRGLFDHFDHDLEFRTDERVMIVIGPNGFGKTTTLRLIDALFNQSLHRLAEISFRSIEVSFDQDKSLIVEKEDHTKQDDDGPQLNFIFQDGSGEPKTFNPRAQRRTERWLEMEDLLSRWYKLGTGEAPDFGPLIRLSGSSWSPPRWLQDVLGAVTVRFIDTERLTHTDHPKRTVRVYSEELARIVSKAIAEYAALSHSLDRTFPARFGH